MSRGIVAQFASVETVGGEVTNLKVSLETYVGVFTTIGWVAVGIGVLLLAISPLLKRWMHGVIDEALSRFALLLLVAGCATKAPPPATAGQPAGNGQHPQGSLSLDLQGLSGGDDGHPQRHRL